MAETLHILILEDNFSDVQLIQLELRKAGIIFTIHWAENKTAFIEALDKSVPDLILADYSLPGFDGMAALTLARQRFAEIPVIIVSGAIGEETAIETLKAGATDYVLKQRLKRLGPVIRRAVSETEQLANRRLAEEALHESQQRWGVTLASIGDAVIATDMEGRVTFLNNVAEQLTGWNMAEAEGMPAHEVFNIVNEYTREAVDDPVSIVLQSGKIVGLANHTVLLRKDGRQVPIDDSGAPIRDDKGRILGVVLIFRDISERKKTEQTLYRLNATLEQQVAERTELAECRSKQLQRLAVELIEAEERERQRFAQILHDDLQQSLAAARFQLLAAIEDLPSESILNNVEKLIEQSIRKSRQLSHEISPPVLHNSSLAAGLKWLVRQMSEQFGLQVELEIEAAPVSDCTPQKVFIFRAVQELLFNVVKHAQVKNARMIVSDYDGLLVITVSDQGQGFKPDILSSSTLTVAGFGLLSLRERAQYMGGSLSIESAPGQGSRLSLTIPHPFTEDKSPQAMSECGLGTGVPSTVPATLAGKRIRVVFVDDHHVMRQGLIKLVSHQPGIQVVGEAANGREAIERVRQLRPEVVVMDISMPELDGVEATRVIKADLPEVRVIGLSMYEEDHLAQSMREAGAESFVSKTASSAELLQAIYGT